MPISGCTILNNSTAQAAPTGGTSITLTENGVMVPNGKSVADASNANFLTRLYAVFRNKPPVKQPDKTYSKGKRTGVITQPKLLASGVYLNNICRIELEVHPEATSAEVVTLMLNGSQLLTDADFQEFWKTGSLA